MNCYNGEEFLAAAIQSILDQTYQDWEIVFWDNQSTDDSAAIAQSFGDPRIRYFYSPKHTILGEARKMALEKTRGQWVAFLDADDLWLPDKLSRQMERIQESADSVGFVYGRAEIFFENNPARNFAFKRGRSLPEGHIFEALCREDFVPFLSGLVNKERLEESGGLSEKYKHSIDYFMFLNLAYKYPVLAVQEVCCRYRIHGSNLTHTQKPDGIREAIEIVSAYLPAPGARIGVRYHYGAMVLYLVRSGQWIAAISTMIRQRCALIVLRKIFYGFYDRFRRLSG